MTEIVGTVKEGIKDKDLKYVLQEISVGNTVNGKTRGLTINNGSYVIVDVPEGFKYPVGGNLDFLNYRVKEILPKVPVTLKEDLGAEIALERYLSSMWMQNFIDMVLAINDFPIYLRFDNISLIFYAPDFDKETRLFEYFKAAEELKRFMSKEHFSPEDRTEYKRLYEIVEVSKRLYEKYHGSLPRYQFDMDKEADYKRVKRWLGVDENTGLYGYEKNFRRV